ncbi:MAG: autotransporter-associated beta strand repeat-containing protein, partial [Opitutales bacterium]|nr:autotransporter-associated beta strand repeat-containing protein [Opitutales bacterium]
NTTANFGGESIVVAAGLLRNGITDAAPSGSLLSMSAGAGYDLNGFDQTLDAIGGQGFATNSSLTTSSTLTVGSATDATFGGSFVDNSVASGGAASLKLTKVGTGKLTLTGLNSNVGLTTVNAGILELAGNGVFGSGNVRIMTGASVNVARSLDLLFTNSLENAGDFRQTGTGMTSLMSDNALFTGKFYVDAGILQVGNGTTLGDFGNIGNATKVVTMAPGVFRFNRTVPTTNMTRVEGTGDYVQQSTSVLTIGTDNPLFTGRAIAANGTMEAGTTGAFSAAGRVIAENGATFKLTASDALGTVSYGVPMTLNGTGIADATTYTGYLGNVTLNGGNLTSDASPNAAGSWILLGNVSATADSTISAQNVNVGLTSATRDFNVAAGKVLTFSGSYADAAPVTGVSGLSKSGNGTLVLSGSAKTYTGTNTLTGGFLKLADAAQLGGSSATVHANLVFMGGAIEFTGGGFGRNFLVKDGGAGFNATSSANPFVVSGSDQIDFDNAAPAAVRPLTLSGTSALGNTFSAGLLDNADAAQAFSSVVKNGVGQWIIGGSGNALAPNATAFVNEGILGFTLGSLGPSNSTGAITLGNTATLRWEVGNTQDLGARLKVVDGAAATLRFEDSATVTFANGFDFTTGGNAGTGSLVKSGNATLVLAGANTFAGGLNVAQGKVVVSNVGGLGSGTGAVAIGTGATLALTFSQDYAFTSPLSGQGTLSLEGTGTSTLSSSNVAFTGVTVISGGRVVAGVQSSPAPGTVGTLGGADPTDPSKLVFVGGTLELAGSDRLTRRFTVANGGAKFFANAANASAFRIDGTSQVAFDAATATSRPLTLSGDSLLDNTFATTAFGSPAASQVFSSIVKNGVGQWIVGGSGNTLAPNADVSVNGGVLGFYLDAL